MEAIYLVDQYAAERERGTRWDDPSFDLAWPFSPRVISDKDRVHPDLDRAWHLAP